MVDKVKDQLLQEYTGDYQRPISGLEWLMTSKSADINNFNTKHIEMVKSESDFAVSDSSFNDGRNNGDDSGSL